jgi:transposase-like protein
MVALRRTRDEADPAARLVFIEEAQAGQRLAREDALPEHTSYADTGCELHSRCLTCPLERCRYDVAGGLHQLRTAGRDREVLSLHAAAGLTVDDIAARVGISRRTVFRILARHRATKEEQHDGTDF